MAAMNAPILVINPNSSTRVTEDIDRALDPLRGTGGFTIECLTLAEGPPGIETERHVAEVAPPLCRLVEGRNEKAAAFVIACFSDPGLHAVREVTTRPVLGIAECGLLTALTLGERIGIVSILAASVPRHRRMVRALGIESRLAGDRPLGLGVGELPAEEMALGRLVEVGERLRDQNGADVLVLGCAGMARYRARLEEALALPVVDPTQAAVAMAISAVRLGYGESHR